MIKQLPFERNPSRFNLPVTSKEIPLTKQKLIDRVNWRLIVIHLFATLFFMIAAKEFIMLYDIELLSLIGKYSVSKTYDHLFKQDGFTNRLTLFSFWAKTSPLIGLVISFVLSLMVCLVKKHFWLNSFLVLIISFILYRTGFYDSQVINTIFLSFGRLFASYGIVFILIANGIFLLLIGLFVFFSKVVNDFIQDVSGNKSDVDPLDDIL